jgi:adenine deaminase
MKKAPNQIFLAIILAIFVLGLFATAQGPAAKTSGRLVVHAGKLLDVHSGKTLTDQAIVIEGGKIVSVGPFARPPAHPVIA